ncbi:hypothetical protein HZS_4917 [Henneguya salminicola]|nr:hypothetical protein HZS_4917 [Henneguya salminicola]
MTLNSQEKSEDYNIIWQWRMGLKCLRNNLTVYKYFNIICYEKNLFRKFFTHKKNRMGTRYRN